MSFFLILIIVAAIAALLSCVIIIRRRKPLKPKALETPRQWWKTDRETIAQWSRELLEDLRFISTWGQWRYKTPWILILGDNQTGKSSVAASVKNSRQNLLLKERLLGLRTPVAWHFFNGGVLIDPDDVSGGSSNTDHQGCSKVLDRLNDLRPERPLDGVVLAISAKILQSGDPQTLQNVAESCYRQLWMIQKKFEFSFPVYILVTHCDAVEGFDVFWSTQSEGRKDDVMGWSSPYSLDTNFNCEWVDEAFESISDALGVLQLETAAGDALDELVAQKKNLEDEYFLFPRRFKQSLHEPLRNVLKYVLKPSAYHANFYFRGIYFCGAMGDEGEVGVRKDVRFVNKLFDEKVFVERNLAQATRVGLWSRKQKIKRIQMGSVAAFVVLCTFLGFSSVQLNKQKDLFLNTLSVVKQESSTLSNKACPDSQGVYDLLDSVSNLRSDWTYSGIPASWFDRRITTTSAEYLAYKAFEDVVFPNLQCHLDKKADEIKSKTKVEPTGGAVSKELTAMRQQIVGYGDSVLEFEKSYRIFQELNRVISPNRGQEALDQLNRLAQYVYGRPLPKSVYNPESPLIHALASVHPDKPPQSMADLRKAATDNILHMVVDMSKERDARMQEGPVLLNRLESGSPTLVADTRRFTWWLKWVQEDWLGDVNHNNPCTATYWALTPVLEKLEKYGFPAVLQKINSSLSKETCYRKNMKVLENISIAPAPSLVTTVDGHRQMSVSARRELNGLENLLSLDFMQRPVKGEFQCRAPLAGWKPQNLSKAAAYIHEYVRFADAKGLQQLSAADRPLYDRIARAQLLRVLDNEMMHAQVASDLSDVQDTDATGSLDEELRKNSRAFTQAVQPLQFVLRMYKSLNFDQSFGRITQCTQHFATDALANIDYLSDISRLYQPAYTGGTGAGGIDSSGAKDDVQGNNPQDNSPQDNNPQDNNPDKSFYSLGSVPQTEAYLDKQFKRAQILGGYAAPYVKFLSDSAALDDSSSPSGQSTTYWANTLDQIRQQAQFATPTSQPALLNSFITNELRGMSNSNCSDRLNKYYSQAVAVGNDLFSDRRAFLTHQAQLYCENYVEAENFTLYRQYAKQFNRVAAEGFPFDSDAATGASLAGVRQLVRDYLQNADSLKAYANQLSSGKRPPMQKFIREMNAVAAFMKPNLAADQMQPVDLKLQFRAREKDSKGSNQLVSWQLSNGSQDINFPPYKQGDTAQMTWQFGQPLILELDWANLSDYVPQQDDGQTDMHVDGNKVTFKVSGNWALFRWLELHRPTTGQAGDAKAASNATYLEFRVPVRRKADGADAKTHTVYLYLAVSASDVDPDTKKPVNLTFPKDFPFSAPLNW